jgi:prevent-host-death family protein
MNAITLPVAEAQARLSELVAAVAAGADVTLTEGGAPVARLVAAAGALLQSDEVDHYMNEVRAVRRGLSLGGLSAKDLVAEGRE